MLRWFFVLLLIACDLASKEWVFTSLAEGEHWQILPCVSFVKVKNFGIGFGLAQGWLGVIITANILILAILGWWLHREQQRFKQGLLMLLLAGGIGNCVDRLLLGYVRDFIFLSYHSMSWWVFNMADVYISIAFLSLAFYKQD